MILEETNPDDLEYKKQLGLVGLELVKLSEMVDDQRGDASGVPSFRRSRGNDFEKRSLVDYRGYDDEYSETVEDAFSSEHRIVGSIVEQLRATTLKVKLLNAMSDLIYPLSERLNSVSLEIDSKNNIRHHETSMYLDRMLKAIDALNGKQDANRGFYLAAKEFFRHPLLTIGRGISDLLISGIKFGLGALFGFKNKKSDTDRIVDAINRQTEWHMNNQIDQGKGFFQRLREQGAIGMAVRGVANAALKTVGVGKNRAQEIEDMRSRGIDPREQNRGLGGVFKNIRDSISSRVYADDIVLKGRLGREQQQNSDGMLVYDEKLYNLFDSLINKVLDELSTPTTAQPTKEREVVGERVDDCSCSGFIVDSIDKMKNQQKQLSVESWKHNSELMTDLFRKSTDELVDVNSEIVKEQTRTRNQTDRRNFVEDIRHDNEQIRKRAKDKQDQEVYELIAEQRDGVYEVVKHTKQTAKETKASRLQMVTNSLMNFGSKIISGLASVVGVVGTAATSIIAAIWASSRMKSGANVPVPVGAGGGTGGGVGRNLALGAGGLAVAGGLAIAGTQVEEGSKAEAGLSIAGSAATGAALLSFLGPKGMLIGGAIGGLYGLYQNWDSLFEKEVEQEKTFTEKVNQTTTETLTKAESVTNNLVVNTKERTEENTNDYQQIGSLVDRVKESAGETKVSVDMAPITSMVERLSTEAVSISEKAVDLSSPYVEIGSEKVSEILKDVQNTEQVNRIVDVSREIKQSAINTTEVLSDKFTALQDRMSLSLDSMRDVFDSLKSQTIKTIEVLNEHTNISKEIASTLKTIANNTKQNAQPETSPFSDATDSGILKTLFGR